MRKGIKYLEEFISSVSFAVMLMVIILNVFARILFDKSFGFTEEIAFISFAYSVFFGVSYLYKRHALIAIDVIIEKLPVKIRYFATILNFLILTIVNAFFLYLSVVLTIEGWERPTAFLEIPYTYIYLSAAISFLLMTIYSIQFFLNAIKRREVMKEELFNDLS